MGYDALQEGAVKAYVLINVRASKTREVLQQLRQIEGIESADACWGRPDIFAVYDGNNLAQVVIDRIQTIDGVESTDTHIVVE